MELTDSKAIVITYSDINQFLTCRRQWHWGYVQDWRKPEKPIGPLALGTRVHAALEHYYKGLGPAGIEHERLVKLTLANLEEADAPLASWEMDQLYKDIIVSRNCVAAHQEWLEETGADDCFEIEAVEQIVQAPICDGRVLLRGKVDVLFRNKITGMLTVNDLKTDGGKPGLREQLERSWQHNVYLAVLRLSKPDQHIDKAVYTVMKKVARKSDKVTVHRFPVPGTTRTAPTKLRQLEVICLEMLRSMELATDEGSAHAYPTPNQTCTWCPFKQPCEVMDESSSAARAMLDDQYTRGGRHGRYV